MNKHEMWELQSMQAAPLSVKVRMTQQRIRDWVYHFGVEGVYVSFSGGKDSTVLLHLVRELFPEVPAVFCDVPTQYPELKEFAKTFDNVEIVKPKISFMQVCEKYGFPMISKEVAECVSGARKYLTSMTAEMDAATNERTNERPYHHQFEKLCGSGKFEKPDRGGATENTESAVVSENLRKLLTMDLNKAIKNLRVQRLMGINSRKGMVTEETIPDKADRSKYSCERYQFFLDAPFEISEQCCHVMKKYPMAAYTRRTGRVPMTAQMASESRLRTQVWLKQGCNAFDAKKKVSNPMAFWTEQDVLLYIYQNHLPICSVYGDVVKVNEVEGQLDWADLKLFDIGVPTLKTTGCERTGCMLCGFGCHLEKDGESRFQQLKETHPGMYKMLDVFKNNGVTFREAIDWANENGNLHIRY